MLADIRYWEKIAQKHHFAIPHFNVWNVEMLEGVMDARLYPLVLVLFTIQYLRNMLE